jgi:alkyldihydroxyacetonephosphate synthase
MTMDRHSFVSRLTETFGDRVRSDETTLASHARDWWVLSDLQDLEGSFDARPCAVVEARSTEDVARVLQLAREAAVPVITRGGGSGVCGGVRARGGELVLSTRGMDGLVELDATDLLVTFRAGTNGLEAEERVQRDGLTIGHWPQSIALSTVGGWVATRAAGQFSTAYGNIEDVVHDLEVVLPDGAVLRTRRTPRAAAGPDLRQLFLGSEGTLGVVTEVTFSLRPLPEVSVGQSFHFASFDDGLAAIRAWIGAGWRPPVVRLYDEREAERGFGEHCPAGRAFALLLHEGPTALVDVQLAGVRALAATHGGVEAGDAAVQHWLGHRNQVPGFRGFLEKGIILDTIEVAAPWGRVKAVYDGVVGSLSSVPNLLVASAHSSHSYRSGTNLYFTFAARPSDRAEMAATYTECWRRTMEATLAAGGGIAHHHGIGRVRSGFLGREIGATGVDLLRRMKHALDPDGLLNPGVLLPEGGAV